MSMNQEQTIQMIISKAKKYGIDPDLAVAMAQQESNFNPNARGGAGEIGLFQLKPGTALEVGIDPSVLTDPEQNTEAGLRYFSKQLKRFGSNELALAAYNAGPGATSRAGNRIPTPQAQQHIKDVMGYYHKRRSSVSMNDIFRGIGDVVNTGKEVVTTVAQAGKAVAKGVLAVAQQPTESFEETFARENPVSQIWGTSDKTPTPTATPLPTVDTYDSYLERARFFNDTQLAQRKVNPNSEPYYNDYYEQLGRNNDLGMTTPEIRKFAGGVLLNLARVYGGNLVEPQFWYERGLATEFFENMPALASIKEAELKAVSPSLKKKDLKQLLDITIASSTPESLGAKLDNFVAEMGEEDVFDRLMAAARDGANPADRLYLNDEVLKKLGFGNQLLLPNGRKKLKDARQYVAEEAEKQYMGKDKTGMVGGLPSTFAGTETGGGGSSSGYDQLTRRMGQKLLGGYTPNLAKDLLSEVYSSPIFSNADKNKLLKDVLLKGIATSNSIDNVNAFSNPQIWSELGIGDVFYNSIPEIERAQESAIKRITDYEYDIAKKKTTGALLEAIAKNDMNTINHSLSLYPELRENLGDQYVAYVIESVGRHLGSVDEIFNTDIDNVVNNPQQSIFKKVVDDLSRAGLTSKQVNRFILGLMPNPESTPQEINEKLARAIPYYRAIDGAKTLFVDKRTDMLLRMYDDINDNSHGFIASINRDRFATFFRKYYNEGMSTSEMESELSKKEIPKDDQPAFDDFIKKFFNSDVFFGIEQVEIGTGAGQKVSDNAPVNLTRRDLEKLAESWIDAKTIYKYAGAEGYVGGANRTVKETYGVFYNDYDESVLDRPSVMPIELTQGANADLLKAKMDMIKEELVSAGSKYGFFTRMGNFGRFGGFTYDPKLTLVFDWDGNGSEFDVIEELPTGEAKFITRFSLRDPEFKEKGSKIKQLVEARVKADLAHKEKIEEMRFRR